MKGKSFEQFCIDYNLTEQEKKQCYTYLIAIRMQHNLEAFNKMRVILKNLFI